MCGAVAKGRSSSPTLKHEIKQIAALAIAGDLWVRAVYIPSEDNPSDVPSRGIVRTWRRHPGQRVHAKVKKDKLKHDVLDDIRRCTQTGSIASRNIFRRSFRKYEWSDVSSLSSLDSAVDVVA